MLFYLKRKKWNKYPPYGFKLGPKAVAIVPKGKRSKTLG
jgi:hypothetical protein